MPLSYYPNPRKKNNKNENEDIVFIFKTFQQGEGNQ
jgi:hypothetical protein